MTIFDDVIAALVTTYTREIVALRADLATSTAAILQEIRAMSASNQATADADTAAILKAVADIGDAVTNIQAEIAALEANNPSIDLTGLNAAVAQLQPAVDAVTAIAPPPPPPPPGP